MILDSNPAFFDYKDSMNKLFNNFSIKKVLEFGLGFGTKDLLLNDRKVTSIELQTYSEYEGWFDYMTNELKGNANWIGYLCRCSDNISQQLLDIVIPILKLKYDFVFVDPAFSFRPELVNICISEGIPIIAAHDTNFDYPYCKWSSANKDKKYYQCVISQGLGTTYYFKRKKDFIKFKELL